MIARLSAPAAGAAAVNCASCPTGTSLDDALDFAGAVHDTAVNDAGSWDWGVYHGEEDFYQ